MQEAKPRLGTGMLSLPKAGPVALVGDVGETYKVCGCRDGGCTEVMSHRHSG